jgi:hypothetical protein
MAAREPRSPGDHTVCEQLGAHDGKPCGEGGLDRIWLGEEPDAWPFPLPGEQLGPDIQLERVEPPSKASQIVVIP